MTGPSRYPVLIRRGENQTAEYYFSILNKLIFVVYRNKKNEIFDFVDFWFSLRIEIISRLVLGF